MPLVARNAGSNVVTFDGSDAVVEQAPSDVDVVMDEVKAAKLRCLQEYRRMVDATKDILLLKLTFSPAGVRLFDDLCRWVDVNQVIKPDASLPLSVAGPHPFVFLPGVGRHAPSVE